MDKSTKIIFALLASGLWANAGAVMFHSAPAKAANIYDMGATLDEIESEVHGIANGSCNNDKIC